VSFETVNFRCPQQGAKEKMQPKHSTTECRHDGIGIPSATRLFAVANKNKQNKKLNRGLKATATITKSLRDSHPPPEEWWEWWVMTRPRNPGLYCGIPMGFGAEDQRETKR